MNVDVHASPTESVLVIMEREVDVDVDVIVVVTVPGAAAMSEDAAEGEDAPAEDWETPPAGEEASVDRSCPMNEASAAAAEADADAAATAMLLEGMLMGKAMDIARVVEPAAAAAIEEEAAEVTVTMTSCVLVTGVPDIVETTALFFTVEV